MTDLAAARSAKLRLETALDAIPGIAAVGLARDGDGWAIHVNLTADDPTTRAAIPTEIDGVRVTVATTGRATPRDHM